VSEIMSGESDLLATEMRQAVAHHAQGRFSEAESIYRRVLSRDPGHAGALHGLGVLAYQTGHARDAVRLLERALQHRPDSADSLNALGLALRDTGQPQDAAAAHRRAMLLKPLEPAGFTHLGLALRDMGQLADAEAACRQAIALAPDKAVSHNNLATVLMRAGRFDDAASALHEALRLQPDFLKAMNNLGTTRLWAGRPADAVVEYDRALRLAPQYPEVRWHRAIALLTLGDWQRGWPEYQWRWRCADYRALRYQFPRPVWDGSPLAGKRILLTHEQGLGDSIQFVRYAPLLAQRGARVLLLCQPELTRLFTGVDGVERVIAAPSPSTGSGVQSALTPGGEGTATSWPPPELHGFPFDAYLPLLSLPLRFATTPRSLPAAVPYLFANDAEHEKWRVRLEAHGRKEKPATRRVGLVWAGRPIPDPLRTCGLQALAPLAAVPGVRFISLQVGAPAAEADHPPAGMDIDNFSNELTDFTETAALIANLDLVITIDSAVAHLAGALGRPTWTLLPHVADWRWLQGRDDTPWYPTMRLFRQPHRGDWATVAARVAKELAIFVK
jgi:Flp pilus assembly protein TadD